MSFKYDKCGLLDTGAVGSPLWTENVRFVSDKLDKLNRREELAKEVCEALRRLSEPVKFAKKTISTGLVKVREMTGHFYQFVILRWHIKLRR